MFRAANFLKHVAEMPEVIALFSLRSQWAGTPAISAAFSKMTGLLRGGDTWFAKRTGKLTPTTILKQCQSVIST